MARTARSSCGATPNGRVHSVYLIEELSPTNESQSPVIVKIGRAGLDPEIARRACERGNARTLVVRYSTEPLTTAEAGKVEHMVHRWLHQQALQREWFACPNVDFARQAIDRAIYHIRYPETEFFLRPLTEPTVPNSPIARSIAALRALRTQALKRGKAKKALEYDRKIERVQRQGHARRTPWAR